MYCEHIVNNYWVFPKIGVPQNGWFILENPIKMGDLGVPLFLETPLWVIFYTIVVYFLYCFIVKSFFDTGIAGKRICFLHVHCSWFTNRPLTAYIGNAWFLSLKFKYLGLPPFPVTLTNRMILHIFGSGIPI